MIYVSSDIHGYPLKDYLRLLDKANFSDSDDLFILGDVIDRNGDGGVAMLLWMLRQANVHMILGNHEAMFLSCRFIFDTVTEEMLDSLNHEKMSMLTNWIRNGARPTMAAMRELFRRNEEMAHAIYEYLEECPLYEVLDVSDRQFLLTHSGLGNFQIGKKLSEYSPEDFLWNRPEKTDRYFEKTMTVFGHTPTQYYGQEYAGKMLKTSTWIDIDTGAAAGGSPMLLRLDDEMPFYC